MLKVNVDFFTRRQEINIASLDMWFGTEHGDHLTGEPDFIALLAKRDLGARVTIVCLVLLTFHHASLSETHGMHIRTADFIFGFNASAELTAVKYRYKEFQEITIHKFRKGWDFVVS